MVSEGSSSPKIQLILETVLWTTRCPLSCMAFTLITMGHTMQCCRWMVHVTDSQKGWGWQEPLEVILSNSGPPRDSCLGPCPDSFSISPRTKSPQTLWATCASAWSPSQCFLMIWWKLLCFSLCPLPLILSLGTTERSLAPSSLCPPFSHLYTLTRSPLSLLSSRLNSPSSLYLSSEERYSGPLVLFLALHWTLQRVHVSLVLESPELDTVLQMWPHWCWVEGKDHHPQPASSRCHATAKIRKDKISWWN